MSECIRIVGTLKHIDVIESTLTCVHAMCVCVCVYVCVCVCMCLCACVQHLKMMLYIQRHSMHCTSKLDNLLTYKIIHNI